MLYLFSLPRRRGARDILLILCAVVSMPACGRTTSPRPSHCSVDPGRLVFDAAHPTRTFVLTNTDSRPIRGEIASYGSFLVAHVYDLAPGESDTVTVWFRPRYEGRNIAEIRTGCSPDVQCEGQAIISRRVLAPSCDTYTTWVEPDRNFEGDPTLLVGILGPTPPTGFEQAYLRFSLSQLPFNYVARGSLTLHQNGCEPGGAAIRMAAGASNDTVDCSTATASRLLGGFHIIEAERLVGCETGPVEFDVTALLNGYFIGVHDIRGFVVMPVGSEPGPSRHRFDSVEGLNPPTLTVDFFTPR